MPPSPLSWLGCPGAFGNVPVHKLQQTTTADLVALMQRVAGGDKAAFQRLYAATSAKLYGIVLRILVRRDLADEALQDVYIRVWEKAGDYDPSRASPITWLATIARNRALDEVRRVRPISMEEAPEVMQFAADDPDAFEQLASSDDAKRLRACLDGLERERKEIVVLAYFNGLSREELAARFGRPEGTIKTWIHRSLAQLKACLGQ